MDKATQPGVPKYLFTNFNIQHKNNPKIQQHDVVSTWKQVAIVTARSMSPDSESPFSILLLFAQLFHCWTLGDNKNCLKIWKWGTIRLLKYVSVSVNALGCVHWNTSVLQVWNCSGAGFCVRKLSGQQIELKATGLIFFHLLSKGFHQFATHRPD